MRLVSFVAPTSQKAMALLRAKLGEDAIIVTTQTLENGSVRLTGAVAEKDIDLVDVLTPVAKDQNLDWLTGLGDFHEWPNNLYARFASEAIDEMTGDPKAALTSLMHKMYRFDSVSNRHSQPIVFSGPPGCGKTTTIAKLAALQILAGKSVDVLTMDAERTGAIEQLTALLDPLGVQPKVISVPGSARSFLADCSSDFILVDTPGSNPYSPTDLGRLSTLINHIGAELLLVMEAGRSPSDSAEIGESYAALGAKRMIVTKLDMAKRLGGFLAAALPGLALCGAGIGPTIGDGFRPLSADGLARLLLCRYDHSLIEEARA